MQFVLGRHQIFEKDIQFIYISLYFLIFQKDIQDLTGL